MHFACLSKYTHMHKQAQAKTNTLISQILHKSHNYNAHHSSSVFLAVNHMNYNCFMNILRGKATCFNLGWNLPLFQGQFTWTTPHPLLLLVSSSFFKPLQLWLRIIKKSNTTMALSITEWSNDEWTKVVNITFFFYFIKLELKHSFMFSLRQNVSALYAYKLDAEHVLYYNKYTVLNSWVSPHFFIIWDENGK